MNSKRSHFVIIVFFMMIIFVTLCFFNNAEARGIEGSRGGEAVEGPRGNVAVEGPQGNVAVEGPQGNVAVGARFPYLPDSANAIIVGDRTYNMDANGVYYLPCDDDNSVYCVVDPPSN
jgi:hypothetical protein